MWAQVGISSSLCKSGHDKFHIITTPTPMHRPLLVQHKHEAHNLRCMLRCLALVSDFQAGSSLACFWGSGPDAVCWKMPESYFESDGRELWQGSESWAPRAGWPQSPGMQLSFLVACTRLHKLVPDLRLGRKVQHGGMFAEKHATLIIGLELIIGRI